MFRGALKRKRGARPSIHYNADPATAQLLFRIVISINQISVYGAVADMCEELAQQISDHSSSSTGNPVAKVNKESEYKVAPTVVSILTNPPLINAPVHGDLLRSHNERFEHLPEDIQVIQVFANIGFIRKVSLGQF